MASVVSDRINKHTSKSDLDGDMNKSPKLSESTSNKDTKNVSNIGKGKSSPSDNVKESRSNSAQLSIQVTEVSSSSLDAAALPIIDVISTSKSDSAGATARSAIPKSKAKTKSKVPESGKGTVQPRDKPQTKETTKAEDTTENAEVDIKSNLAAAAAAAADPTNLIVNYVPSSILEVEFRKMFEPFGEIVSCRLIFDRLTGRHMGYGFVKYVDQASAESAIMKYDGFHVENKRLKVSFARPSGGTKRSNLYVSGLPIFYTEQQLADLFSPFGKVIDTKILRTDTGESRGVGFARVDSVEAAERAIEELHNTVPALGSSRIAVKHADRGDRRGPVHVGRGVNLGDSMIGRHGGIMDPTSMYKSGTSPSLTYGDDSFFNFGYGAASTASMYGYGSPAGSHANYSSPVAGYGPIRHDRFARTGTVSPPRVFTSNGGAIHSYTGAPGTSPTLGIDADMNSPMASPSRNGQYAGVCLFCFHLPYELDERGLQGMFEPYGTVVHVKVIRDLQTGRSKGYGFVNMQTYQQALSAIGSLNGFALGGKHLKVEFKKPSSRRGGSSPHRSDNTITYSSSPNSITNPYHSSS